MTNDDQSQPIDWDEGRWTHQPVRVQRTGDDLVAEAAEGSDAWRVTSYGFVHDSEHGLLAGLGAEEAIEVDFVASFTEQFDQAGIFVRADDEHWIKAGLEFADGVLQVGAVVTWPVSDWSVAQVPQWHGRPVTVRVSRSGDAITVRARAEGEPLRLVRVVPVPPEASLSAGPMLCAPSRAGLEVRFTGWRRGEPDRTLHED